MHVSSNKFLQEITQRINKLKEFSNQEAIQDLSGMAIEMENMLNNTDSPAGIPPPDDLDYSYNSLSSSVSIFDVPFPEQISHIKDKNKELRNTATLTLKDFKKASRNLLSKSQIHSNKSSVVFNEIENARKVMDEENKLESNEVKEIEKIKSMESENDMAIVYQKIQEIQKEINKAAQKLLESEKMILSTEEKNFILENRIKRLEESVNSVVTEGPEKSKNENCMCVIY